MDTTPEETQLSSSSSSFLGAVYEEDTRKDPWAVELSLQGTPVSLHIDTGAEVTVISKEMRV